ncbi:MAG: hypothetical protein ACHQQS_10135 [Thermoanaerobaculales bacterium]
MSKQTVAAASLVLAVMVVGASTSSAQEVKASGINAFVPKVNESFGLADGTTANRISLVGFIMADDPSNPLRLASMTCSGTSIARKDQTEVRSAGTCDTVDKDGDVAFYWWRIDEKAGGHWGFLGGTGKWTNVEGGGTYQPTYQWKDGRTGDTWKGSWKTK